MDEELKEHLNERLKLYRGRHLAAVLAMMRIDLMAWLREEHLDLNTYSLERQTTLIVAVLCEAEVHIN